MALAYLESNFTARNADFISLHSLTYVKFSRKFYLKRLNFSSLQIERACLLIAGFLCYAEFDALYLAK
ncbi:hypothetical protein CAMRE0001_2044 [Campylobacter rectus RM3267]|uniref:Uncharacterized protein n=1 Tax=Campylobacter rectus RM3267 TaxID=553218 RepID=B9D4I8_CAMRE|nr:hypothetical protein CAMRE0001_2044 [Campylobacter rectus RM3267]